MIRKLLAIIIGVLVAGITVMLIQELGHGLYPPPADLDVSDREFMADYVAGLPWGPLAFVLASYVIGTLAGGWAAASVAGESSLLFAGIVGLLMLAGAIWNVMIIPHPTWFTVTAVIGVILATLLAARFSSKPSAGIKAI